MPDPSYKDFLRLARQKVNLSARSVSKKAGLSDSYLSKVEAGTLKPSFEAFASLVAVLQLNDREIAFLVRSIGGSHE